jgi:hypothetical protein
MKYIDPSFYEQLFGVDLIITPGRRHQGRPVLGPAGGDQRESFDRAATNASEIMNAITGNRIESVGFANLSEKQQGYVKKATAYQTQHFLNTGMMDMQAGSVSMGLGAINFSYNTPLGITKYGYVHELARELLAQVDLYSNIAAFNPKPQPATDPERKHIFHKWDIGAKDESLFVSDGTSADGGQVRFKVSDKYQAEIAKLAPVNKSESHLTYTDISGNKEWQDNALVPKKYVDDRIPEIRGEE